ncbi:MAG: hypothetical protein ACRC4L_02715 [Mycoplasma sp.]
MAKDGKFRLWVFLVLLFTTVTGSLVYALTKMLNLSGWVWHIVFFCICPVIGNVIYAMSNGK